MRLHGSSSSQTASTGHHPHPCVRCMEQSPHQGDRGDGSRLLPNSCVNSGAAGPDRKGAVAGTPTPAQTTVGGQEVRATWGHPGLKRGGAGWLPGALFYQRESSLPELGVLVRAWPLGKLLWSPRRKAKSPRAESWPPPGWPS